MARKIITVLGKFRDAKANSNDCDADVAVIQVIEEDPLVQVVVPDIQDSPSCRPTDNVDS